MPSLQGPPSFFVAAAAALSPAFVLHAAENKVVSSLANIFVCLLQQEGFMQAQAGNSFAPGYFGEL